MNDPYIVDIPKRLVGNKERRDSNGEALIFIDLSKEVKEDGYGVFYPKRLIEEHPDYYTLTIPTRVISDETGYPSNNKIVVEYRFNNPKNAYKPFEYTAEEFYRLLYDKYGKNIKHLKKEAEKLVFAQVTEKINKDEKAVLYVIGYYWRKTFKSKDLATFRQSRGLDPKDGVKVQSPTALKILKRNLTEQDVVSIRKLLADKKQIEDAITKLELEKKVLSTDFKAVKQVEQRLHSYLVNVASAYDEAINLLADKLADIEKELFKMQD